MLRKNELCDVETDKQVKSETIRRANNNKPRINETPMITITMNVDDTPESDNNNAQGNNNKMKKEKHENTKKKQVRRTHTYKCET